jgi:GTP-binding protein HflX
MADFLTDKPAKLERAFLVGVQTPDMKDGEAAELLIELKELVENLRIGVTRTELVNLRRPTPAYAPRQRQGRGDRRRSPKPTAPT